MSASERVTEGARWRRYRKTYKGYTSDNGFICADDDYGNIDESHEEESHEEESREEHEYSSDSQYLSDSDTSVQSHDDFSTG